LGSLFDGIGGFPLAAVNAGITPVWASEIETAPVSITKKHFPNMRHLGDITKINGAEIEPVDIISFGSPCQDLSITGRRAGLEGKRSSLFLQALRVIKEMRIATNGKYPARIVWENVPGAFSSNKGRDFYKVIKEICKIAEPDISIPRLAKKYRWLASGAVMGDSWSVAWRVLDAQYFGVPQRRRRIFLIADFTSQRAGEILFKP
jgi:DNA (cytosine-5)-methyltransferase 1